MSLLATLIILAVVFLAVIALVAIAIYFVGVLFNLGNQEPELHDAEGLFGGFDE